MSDLAGSNMDYIKKTVGIANMHYPERSFVIFVINAPFFASFAWKLVKPLVHENTQKKVRILSAGESLKGLQEHIDISQIPEYYGGQMDFGGNDSCRFNCPDVERMDEFVRKLNGEEEGPAQSTVPFSQNSAIVESPDHSSSQGHTEVAPPGKAGEALDTDGDTLDRPVGPQFRRASSAMRIPSHSDVMSSPAPSDGGKNDTFYY